MIEELGGQQANLPIPNSFPVDEELRDVSYDFFSTGVEGVPTPEGRWTSGPSLDGLGEFRVRKATPMGDEPQLAPPMPQGYAQAQQMAGDAAAADGTPSTIRISTTDSLK